MRSKFISLFSKPLVFWGILWIVLTLLYLPSWKGGFEQDFEGWIFSFYHDSFWDVLNRKSAGIPSLYQVTQLQLYLITKLFGTHQILWFLLFTGLYALNGYLLFRLTTRIMNDFGIKCIIPIVIAGVLLTLVNPSMTEAVVWKACYHYHVAVLAVLGMLLWARQYLLTGDNKWVWYSIFLFIPLTFTLEIWYTIPVLVLVLSVAYFRAGIIEKDAFRKTFFRLFIPLMSLLGAHVLANRLIHGNWIAHSAYTSPGSNSLLTVVGRTWSYEMHLLGLARFYPDGMRHFIYEYIGSNTGGLIAIIFVLCFGVIAYLRYPVWNAQKRVTALFAGFSLISLGIILHFPPPEDSVIYNDRYLYFTAFFQWMLVSMSIGFLLASVPKVRNGAYAGLTVALIPFTLILIMNWRHATKVFWAVLDKYRWQDAPVVLLLNLPSSFNGAGIIHAEIPSEFADHMSVYGQPRPQGTVYDVAGYNMQHIWDGAHVVVEDSTHLTVTLNQWGSWWWKRGFGATNYENDLFAVDFTDPGHYYKLTLKRRPPGMVVLYQQGLEWRVVDWSKIGEQQW